VTVPDAVIAAARNELVLRYRKNAPSSMAMPTAEKTYLMIVIAFIFFIAPDATMSSRVTASRVH
jgi:hypothetical protein